MRENVAGVMNENSAQAGTEELWERVTLVTIFHEWVILLSCRKAPLTIELV